MLNSLVSLSDPCFPFVSTKNECRKLFSNSYGGSQIFHCALSKQDWFDILFIGSNDLERESLNESFFLCWLCLEEIFDKL